MSLYIWGLRVSVCDRKHPVVIHHAARGDEVGVRIFFKALSDELSVKAPWVSTTSKCSRQRYGCVRTWALGWRCPYFCEGLAATPAAVLAVAAPL